MDDIPQRQPLPLNDNVDYPQNCRYTAQYLESIGPFERMLPNNTDAAFGKASRAKKPSALLLHYNYGAAAVKKWGRKIYILEDIAKKSRPRKPVPAPSGPSRGIHNRSLTIKKRGRAVATAEKAKIAGAIKGNRKATWDEDDVMLFLWGNSRAARERHFKTSEEKRVNLEQWRQGVDNSTLEKT